MKRTLLFFLLILPLTVKAQTVVFDNVIYYLDDVTLTARVEGNESRDLSGSFDIPESVSKNGIVYSVTSIASYAFQNCTKLTSINIPNSITSIGEWAFEGCTGLTSVTIPNSVTSIGDYTFFNCFGLTSITILNSVTSIGKCTFNGCISLTSVTIPNSVTSIGSQAFAYCTGLTSIDIPNSVTSIGGNAFSNCTGLTSIDIPNSVTSLGYGTFACCSGLTSVTIGNNLTNISEYAFDKCTGLTSVTIPNSVTSIGNGAFYGCKGLTSIDIPNGVTSIGWGAFDYCTGLTSVTIPNSVTRIEQEAFGFCTKLDNINCYAEQVPDCHWASFWDSNYKQATLHVPAASISAYKAVEPWKNFKEIVALPEQEMDYRPLVEEGKHWTYDDYMPLRPAEYDHYYSYDLKGDTLIAGKNCLKLFSDNLYNDSSIRYEGALYEENKKVYCFYPNKDEAILLYDFDCKVGDTLTLQVYYPQTYQVLVKDIQTEDNGGIANKKYTLQIIWNYEEEYVIWIEGVGSMLDFLAMIPASGNNRRLNACVLDGETLYKYIEPDLTSKGYHKMGIEGKRWNYIHYYLDEDGEHRVPYSYVVKGNTIIRRTTYKKLWYQDEKTERFVCLLHETGRTVYKNTDLGNNSYDSPILKSFFEFDRNDFGRVFTWKAADDLGNTNWMVYGVDTIEVKGLPFRRYTCLQKYSEEGEILSTIAYGGEDVWHDIWVEGVGSASSGIEDQIPLHEPPLRTTSDYTYFVSCYEDGECIFTAADFNTPAIKPEINMAYRPFVEDGKVWKVGNCDSGNPVQWVEYYYFDGDTIIDEKACKQMMRQRYVNPDFAEFISLSHDDSIGYIGAWYEEDKKVYVYDDTNKKFQIIYDFSLDAYGTLWLDEHATPFVVGPRQTGGIKGFKGVYRDVMMSYEGEYYHNVTWLEGVGSIDGPTWNVYYQKGNHSLPFLMACAVGDEVIYLNDEYEDGATPEGARKDRFDFTHTTKDKPKAPMRRVTETSETKSLYGEYNELQLDINLEPLAEAYLVRITDETGIAVYEKNINAVNIVGLNIDISSYAEGRYTVTVDNSRESFTGQFEIHSTSIKEVRNNTSEPTNRIYNLQGQRISSLQKGLNIVNGQKVLSR